MATKMTKRAPRPRHETRTRTTRRSTLAVRVRLSAELRAWLEFEVATQRYRSAADLIRQTLDSLAESDDSTCLDPTRSKFRAWKLQREGRTSRVRCGWDGDRPRFCRVCTARFGDVLREIAAERRARARSAA